MPVSVHFYIWSFYICTDYRSKSAGVPNPNQPHLLHTKHCCFSDSPMLKYEDGFVATLYSFEQIMWLWFIAETNTMVSYSYDY